MCNRNTGHTTEHASSFNNCEAIHTSRWRRDAKATLHWVAMRQTRKFTQALAEAFVVLTVMTVCGSKSDLNAAVQSRQDAAAPAPDVTKVGPQAGQRVPDFSLPDQHGQMRTLARLMGPKGLVLVFNRSADW